MWRAGVGLRAFRTAFLRKQGRGAPWTVDPAKAATAFPQLMAKWGFPRTRSWAEFRAEFPPLASDLHLRPAASAEVRGWLKTLPSALRAAGGLLRLGPARASWARCAHVRMAGVAQLVDVGLGGVRLGCCGSWGWGRIVYRGQVLYIIWTRFRSRCLFVASFGFSFRTIVLGPSQRAGPFRHGPACPSPIICMHRLPCLRALSGMDGANNAGFQSKSTHRSCGCDRK